MSAKDVLIYSVAGHNSEGEGGLLYVVIDAIMTHSLRPLREYKNNLKTYIRNQNIIKVKQDG